MKRHRLTIRSTERPRFIPVPCTARGSAAVACAPAVRRSILVGAEAEVGVVCVEGGVGGAFVACLSLSLAWVSFCEVEIWRGYEGIGGEEVIRGNIFRKTRREVGSRKDRVTESRAARCSAAVGLVRVGVRMRVVSSEPRFRMLFLEI